jgi:hypothetical protein
MVSAITGIVFIFVTGYANQIIMTIWLSYISCCYTTTIWISLCLTQLLPFVTSLKSTTSSVIQAWIQNWRQGVEEREETAGGWRTCTAKCFRICTPSNVKVIKSKKMKWTGTWAYRPTREMINTYTVLPVDPAGNRTSGRPMRIWWTILKYALNKQTARAWNGSYGSEQRPLADSHEHGNEPSCLHRIIVVLDFVHRPVF